MRHLSLPTMLYIYLILIGISTVTSTVATQFGHIPDRLQNVLSNTHGSNLYSYPTDFTRGIIPKPLHSHNDYWRDIPFYTAISYGAISIEADVWLINGTLYVGHEKSALTLERTLDSLYIQPILDTLRSQNPTTPFIDGSITKNGVYDTDYGQTLYLFIDVKTSGEETWQQVLKDLQPLLDAGYLTTTDGQSLKEGPITVIGTGNTPFEYFNPDPATNSTPRFVFFDVPLSELGRPPYHDITSLISPIASVNLRTITGPLTWSKGLNTMQLARVQEAVKVAEARSIIARFWNTASFPIQTRNSLWRQLWDAGAELINVDDLKAASDLWQGTITA